MRGQTPHSVHERFPNSRLILELHARETGPKHLSPQGRHLWSFGPFLVKWQPSKSHHKICALQRNTAEYKVPTTQEPQGPATIQDYQVYEETGNGTHRSTEISR